MVRAAPAAEGDMKLALVMCLLLVVFLALAQEPTGAIASSSAPAQVPASDNVTMYVGAVSKTDQFVDLHVSDLAVEENDKPVHIDAVTCGQPEPVLIGLLIDISGSRHWDPLLASHYDALKAFLSSTLTREDGAYIVTFGANPRALAGVTSNLGELDKALDDLKTMQPFGPTAMYDSIAAAGNANFFRKKGRRILIVVGDFEDNVSRNTLEKASFAALGTQTTVYPIVDGADNSSYVEWKKIRTKQLNKWRKKQAVKHSS
jgi:von Willebrand factor type A domain